MVGLANDVSQDSRLDEAMDAGRGLVGQDSIWYHREHFFSSYWEDFTEQLTASQLFGTTVHDRCRKEVTTICDGEQ
jgi:hypothetical protein